MSQPLLGPRGAAAAGYARRGWPVLPLHNPVPWGCSCRRDGCDAVGKHPRETGSFHAAATAEEQIVAWWRRWPHANIGVATGAASGLVVIDIDANHAGERSFAALRREHDIPRTAVAATGSGRHLYFAAAAGVRVASSVGAVGPGVDVRAEGGYIVAPPSRHANGRHYRWIGTRRIAPLPTSLADALHVPAPSPPGRATVAHVGAYIRAALDRECATVRAAREHTRNNTLNRAAFSLGQLVSATGLTEAAVFDGLLAAAADVGLPRREAVATIRSGLRAGQRKPRSVTPQIGARTSPPARSTTSPGRELPSP